LKEQTESSCVYTVLSKGDVWNKRVCADDLSSTLSTVQSVLLGFAAVGFFVCSCTHLPVYFHAKRVPIWGSKTAPQHKPKHSLPKYVPGVNINILMQTYLEIPGFLDFLEGFEQLKASS